jgi:hypothetical protein
MAPAGEQCGGLPHRPPGPIKEFHAYTLQDSSRHAEADTREAFINNRVTPDVVDVARTLVQMKKLKVQWAEVQSYIGCVFTLAPGAQGASAGMF